MKDLKFLITDRRRKLKAIFKQKISYDEYNYTKSFMRNYSTLCFYGDVQTANIFITKAVALQ